MVLLRNSNRLAGKILSRVWRSSGTDSTSILSVAGGLTLSGSRVPGLGQVRHSSTVGRATKVSLKVKYMRSR